jgi:hypothetical protein
MLHFLVAKEPAIKRCWDEFVNNTQLNLPLWPVDNYSKNG